MFDEAFLYDLPSDPYEAVQVMYKKVKKEHVSLSTNVARAKVFDRYIEAFAAIEAYIDATGLDFQPPKLKSPSNPEQDTHKIYNFFAKINIRAVEILRERKYKSYFEKSREKYAMKFGTVFAYQFSDGDISRIQELLNELRDTITESELFDAKHKQRILAKLESLQAELHKKMSNLDRLWGLIGEFGIVLGKFGQDAKPLADRIREIVQITWRTQARAEELPSGATLPLLSESKHED